MTYKVLVRRDHILHEVKFEEIKEGDKVFLDGHPCGAFAVCAGDAHQSGDASYNGWLFYDQKGDGVFPEDVKESILSGSKPHRKVWARIGCWLTVPEEDEAVLFGEDEQKASAVLARLIRSQDITPKGECYIPGSQVNGYDIVYGTAYEPKDVDCLL